MPPQTQPPQPPVDPNKAAANLGFITTMQDHLLQYKAKQNAPQKAQQTPQPAPQPTQQPEPTEPPKEQKAEQSDPKIEELEGAVRTDIDMLRGELKQMGEGHSKEMEDIKKLLKDLAQ